MKSDFVASLQNKGGGESEVDVDWYLGSGRGEYKGGGGEIAVGGWGWREGDITIIIIWIIVVGGFEGISRIFTRILDRVLGIDL